MVEVATTPGTDAAACATEALNVPEPFELELETISPALMAWSMLLVTERDTDAPNTAMADTSASPTSSAEAVWAVRRGLRIEFSRPNLPDMPSRRARGRPRTLDMGRANTGDSMVMPTKMARAPRPTNWIAGADSPAASAATPARKNTDPTTMRRRDDTPWSATWSTRAATGGIRTARRAGLMAETRVTPTPTRSATTTVRPSKMSEPDGRLMPKPLNRASSPKAASTPSPNPMSDATNPVRPASSSTERKTWRRLAPTMRNRASSRVRWPTMIENVLKMVNAPTNREMKANTKRAVEKNPRALLTLLVCSLATVCP